MARGPRIRGFRPAEKIGDGGFAEVFLYQQEGTDAHFAVKVLRVGSPELRRQFEQEAKALGRLTHGGQHPNIVAIHSHGVTEPPDDRLYLAMEYCPQRSYAERLRAVQEQGHRALDPGEVLRVGVQMANALYRAHSNGIVHRDVKPANILIVGEQAKLSDFGIAAVSAEQRGRGAPWFTLEYAAPEVAEQGLADELGDAFALAATLYELAAGVRWCGDGTREQLLQRVIACQVPSIAETVGPELDRLLRTVMVADRAQRALALRSSTGGDSPAQYIRAFGEKLRTLQSQLRYQPTPLDAAVQAPAPSPPVGGAGARPVGPGRQVLAPKPKTLGAWQEAGPEGAVAVEEARPPGPADREPRSGVRTVLAAAAGVVLLAGGVTAAVLLTRDREPPKGPIDESVATAPPASVGVAGPVPVPTVSAQVDGTTVRFTWVYEPVLDGDRFRVIRTDQADAVAVPVPEPEYEVTIAPGERACIEVTVVRSNGRTGTNGGRACAP